MIATKKKKKPSQPFKKNPPLKKNYEFKELNELIKELNEWKKNSQLFLNFLGN